MIRVAIVEDHEVVREGLESVLDRVEDLQVVGSFSTGQALVDVLGDIAPEVVVMDMGLPDGMGSTWTETVKRHSPDTRVIVLTGFHSDDKLMLALDAGVDGFMYKESSADDLVAAVREVHRGNFYVTPEAARKMRNLTVGSGSAVTPREAEVLVALRDGLTTEEVARRLFLSTSTVKTHLASIYRKLEARNRVEAVREAIRRGVIGEE